MKIDVTILWLILLNYGLYHIPIDLVMLNALVRPEMFLDIYQKIIRNLN